MATRVFSEQLESVGDPLQRLRLIVIAIVRGNGDLIGDGAPSNRRGAAMRSEEHTSELQSLMRISYAVFCLKKKKMQITDRHTAHLANNGNRPDDSTHNS